MNKAWKTVTSLEQNVNVFILDATEETLGQKKSGCRESRMLPPWTGRMRELNSREVTDKCRSGLWAHCSRYITKVTGGHKS